VIGVRVYAKEDAMCWMCDHPEAARADYLNSVRAKIRDCGWAIVAVQRSGMRPPWAYTVGLTPLDIPELVVTGMPVTRAHDLLNDIAHHVVHDHAPAPGTQIPLIGGPLIEIVRVAEPSAHLEIAIELYGARVRALQVVHADKLGRWPWDGRYQGVRGGQPVLGPRARAA
jgi:hypothetical protein